MDIYVLHLWSAKLRIFYEKWMFWVKMSVILWEKLWFCLYSMLLKNSVVYGYVKIFFVKKCVYVYFFSFLCNL